MNIKKVERNLNVKFGFIQTFYQMALCSLSGFASVFLLSKEFNNSEIGVVLAMANIFAVILQPVAASFVDSSKRVTLKQMVCILLFAALCFAVVFLFLPDVLVVIAGMFVLLLTMVLIVVPLMNGLVFEFINNGLFINFGVTRGMGSIGYAALSYILGVLIARFGPAVLPYITLTFLLLLFICIISLQEPKLFSEKESPSLGQEIEKQREGSGGIFEFFRHYHKFAGYLLGIILIFTCQNMFSNYLIHVVTRIGGNSQSMGTAIFIAASLELPVMAIFSIVVKKVGVRRMIILSAAFFMIKAIGVLFAYNIPLLYMNQILQIFTFAIIIPASVYYINDLMEEKDRIKGQAYTTSAITAGAVIGNLAGGALIDLYGTMAMLIGCAVAAAGGFICILLFLAKEDELRHETA